DHPDPRVLELADTLRDHGADRLVDATHALGHAGTLIVRGNEQPVAPNERPVAGGEPALGAVCELTGVVGRPRGARHRQGRALPEVVVVDLGDARAESIAK